MRGRMAVPAGSPFHGFDVSLGQHHREVLAGGAPVLVELPLQPFAEREQQQDRDSPPGDRRDGQIGALPLQPRGAGEEGVDDSEVSAED